MLTCYLESHDIDKDADVVKFLQTLKMSKHDRAILDPVIKDRQLKLFQYHGDERLAGCVLDEEGVFPREVGKNGVSRVDICKKCWSFKTSKTGALPKLALANGLWRGDYKLFGLPDLSFIEQLFIAKAMPMGGVVKLSPHLGESSQLGVKGTLIVYLLFYSSIYIAHFLAFLSDPSALKKVVEMPMMKKDIAEMLHIIIMRQKTDATTGEVMLEPLNKLFQCRHHTILMWLEFLIKYNPHYKESILNEEAIKTFQADDVFQMANRAAAYKNAAVSADSTDEVDHTEQFINQVNAVLPPYLAKITTVVNDAALKDLAAETGAIPSSAANTLLEGLFDAQASLIATDTEDNVPLDKLYKTISDILSSIRRESLWIERRTSL